MCPNLQYGLASKQIGAEPWCEVSGDVNGDGATDLIVGRSPLFTAGSAALLLNDGNVLFSVPTNLTGISSARSLALGDMDSDGDLDLVIADQGLLGSIGFANDGVDVLKNDGHGHFAAMSQAAFETGDDEPQGMRLGDMDRNGDLDAVVVIRSPTPWCSRSGCDRAGTSRDHVVIILPRPVARERGWPRYLARATTFDASGAVHHESDGDLHYLLVAT